MDQQVEHSLIQTFLLLKQILRFLGCLFHEKNSVFWTLPLIWTISSVLWFISAYASSLEQIKLCSHYWLIIWKQQFYIFNNDSWNFHKPKQYKLIGLIIWLVQLIFIKWYCKSNKNSRGINAEKLINSAETEDLKLMVWNLWWELVINISKFLTLSAFPTRSLTLPAVITVGMLTRDKTDSLSKEVSVPESIRVVYSRCQINRTLRLDEVE